jgi:hypothetical protein
MEGSISTPDTTGAVTTGPATFSDTSLSWSDAPSASDPSPETTSAAPSADTTDPSALAPTPDGTTPAAGEPPQERWPDILANARAKAAEDALAPYAWAKQISPEEFREVSEMAKRASADPIGYLQDFIKELQAHPQHSAQLRSLAARALAQRGQPTADAEPQPDLPIELADGRVVHLYSAEQQAKREAYLQQKWMQGVEQQLQPLKQTHETLQAERQALAKQQEITHFVTTTFEDVKTWPGMDDPANQKAVAQALAQMPMSSDDPREVSLALNAAYRQRVLPTLSQRAEAKQLDTLQRKAAASTSVNPGSAAASSPRAVTRFDQLPPEAWK